MIVISLGVIVGIILALTGAGGGIIAVPLLVFGVHLSLAQAGPIGLLAVSLAAGLGALMGLRAGIVRYKAALLIATTGMLLSPLGLWLAQRMPNQPLSVLFALVLFWVAWRSYHQGSQHAVQHLDQGDCRAALPCQLNPDTGRFIWNAASVRTFILVGMAAGFLSGLLGVGGGFVLVPVLQRYTPLPMRSIVATSLAVIAMVSLSAVALSSLQGHFDWAIGWRFAAGALAGMLLGSYLSRFLAGPQLSKGFALLAMLVGLGLIGKAFW
jgi:uncharacterized membrane protein YfcA